MAWFRNHYSCGKCGTYWEDEWSCCCDDDCPECGSRHWSPLRSDDLTFLVEQEQGAYSIYVSPLSADHSPDYELTAVTLNAASAKAYVNYRLASYRG